MKWNYASILTLACCILSLAAGQVGKAQRGTEKVQQGSEEVQKTATGRVFVTFHGLKGQNGYLRVALYGSQAGFPSGEPLARRDIRLETLAPGMPLDPLSVTFENLPPGTYAVCAFHDGRSRGKLAVNFLGIPQEEWGMSNNPRPRFRAPRFDETRIGLDAQQDKDITITLHR